jgi:centromere protein C
MIRKTGITLPDTGVRDEDGFEPVEGLFSTGKSTVAGSTRKMNGANGTLGSDDMDEGESRGITIEFTCNK